MVPWRAGFKEPGRSHLRWWESRPPSGDGRMSTRHESQFANVLLAWLVMARSACQAQSWRPLPACTCRSPSFYSITAALDGSRCFSGCTTATAILVSISPAKWTPLESLKHLGSEAYESQVQVNWFLPSLMHWRATNPYSSMYQPGRSWKRCRRCMLGSRHFSGKALKITLHVMHSGEF